MLLFLDGLLPLTIFVTASVILLVCQCGLSTMCNLFTYLM